MTVTWMSRSEIDRMNLLRDLAEDRVRVSEAATLMGLGRRQVFRLATAVLHDFAMTWPQVAMMTLRMHWTKQLAYTITPKSGPMRRMETLLDANRAVSNDLPRELFKRDHWLAAGKLLVHASETGAAADIQRATDELLKVIESEGWMSRAPRRRPGGG